MSSNDSTMRVGVYARRSTPQQEDSLERQIEQVLPYCKQKRYTVVGEPYTDDGICGDVFDKRPGFQKVLRDAQAGLFSVIVTDEWSRLSRQEPIDFIAKVVKPLKDAGVTLDCVAEGPQHWDDLAQLILMTVKASKSQDESKTKSYRVLTGMRRYAALRRLLGGHPPYGYLVEYETVQEPGKAPRLRPVRLVPDRRRAHVVRWMFQQYAEGGWAMDDLARELNARGVEAPPPARRGGRSSRTRRRGEACAYWSRNGIRAILKNPKYTGALVWNRRSRGKYHRIIGGAAVRKPKPSDVANPREEWDVIVGTHEALVSQDVFDRVQARLRANRGGKPSIGAYLFSGLLTCSHCGGTLSGLTCKGHRVYRCHKYDGAGNVVCGFNSVREDWLLARILRVLEEEVLAPDRLKRLREEIRRQNEAEAAPAALDPMRKRLADLEASISKGNENLALLPPDRLPGVVAKVREWEQEAERLRAELLRRKGGEKLVSLEEAVAECEALLWRLREAIAAEDALALREVLRASVVRVQLTWDRRPYGRRTRYILRGGVIHLRPQIGVEETCRALPGSRAAGRRAAPTPPRRSAGGRR
jgi:DNA invertase Pin-like site-specific DNA recombinase